MTQKSDQETPANLVKSTDVIGVEVQNKQGEDLGKIVDIVLNKITGKVCYIAVSFGGFMGLGDRLFAIPWNSIHYNTEKNVFTLNIDKEKLEKAPGFDKDNWPDFNDEIWQKDMDRFYEPGSKY